jgi:hypothetical protein
MNNKFNADHKPKMFSKVKRNEKLIRLAINLQATF